MNKGTVTISLSEFKRLEEIKKNHLDMIKEIDQKYKAKYEELIGADVIVIKDYGLSASIMYSYYRYSICSLGDAEKIINDKLVYEISKLEKELETVKSHLINLTKEYKVDSTAKQLVEHLTKVKEPKWYDGLLNLFK